MTYRVKLRFRAPLHAGFMDTAYELSDTLIHSDTIFSALICSHALLYGKDCTDELLRALVEGKTRLLISSAFPSVGNVHFFPRPKGEDFGLSKNSLSSSSQFKKLKAVRFVDEDVLFKRAQVSLEDVRGQFLTKDREALKEEPFLIIERPRVSVNRYDSSSNLFYFAEVHFNENAGLWFYLSVDADIEKEILSALKLLSEEGFGGDRTYGFGTFDFELEQTTVPNSGNRYLLISVCVPNTAEVEAVPEKVLNYDLVHRTGYVHMSDRRVKKVLAFAEGSVFKKPIEGAILDVSPEGFEQQYGHRVFRYARAFMLPYEGGD